MPGARTTRRVKLSAQQAHRSPTKPGLEKKVPADGAEGATTASADSGLAETAPIAGGDPGADTVVTADPRQALAAAPTDGEEAMDDEAEPGGEVCGPQDQLDPLFPYGAGPAPRGGPPGAGVEMADEGSPPGDVFPGPQYKDVYGPLHRQVSRKETLSGWREEWCVATLNFLIFYASNSDQSVRRCILLSTVQAVTVDKDGCMFRVKLVSSQGRRNTGAKLPEAGAEGGRRQVKEELVLYAAKGATVDANAWKETLEQRSQLAACCRGETVPVLPCLVLGEARQCVKEFEQMLSRENSPVAQDIKAKMRLVQKKTLPLVLNMLFKAWHRHHLHDALAALQGNARQQFNTSLQRQLGLQRITAQLRGMRQRQLHCAFIRLSTRPQAQDTAERRSMAVAKLEVALQHNLERAALQRLHDAARQGPRDVCREALRGQLGEAVAVVAKRLLRGERILRAVLRQGAELRCRWALRTWEAASTKSSLAEARELVQSTAELNANLMARIWRRPAASYLAAFVAALRNARSRKLLFGFMALAAGSSSDRRRPGELSDAPR